MRVRSELMVLVYPSLLIVFPDKVVGWLEDRLNVYLGWKGVAVTGLVGIGLVATIVERSERLGWTHAVTALGVVVAIRILYALIVEMFVPRD